MFAHEIFYDIGITTLSKFSVRLIYLDIPHNILFGFLTSISDKQVSTQAGTKYLFSTNNKSFLNIQKLTEKNFESKSNLLLQKIM